MAESEIPADLRERARDTARKVIFEANGDLSELDIGTNAIIIALLAEREQCAKIAADFNWVLPMYGDMALNSATDDAACSVQEQIAAAIRQDNPNET